MAGFLSDLFGGDVPQYVAPKMDPNLQASNQGIEERDANTSAQDYTDKLNAGLPGSAAIPSQQATGANLGGNTNMGMGAAISAKAGKLFDQSLSQIKEKNQFQGLMMQHQQTAQAAQLSNQLTSIQRGIATNIAQFQTEADATRYAILNGIMSGAGSVGGAFAGNRAASHARDVQRTKEEQGDSLSIGGNSF